jgi:prepilin-type processing-associated H-X9-DG protein
MTFSAPQDPLQYAHPSTAPRTSTWSIVSLVCGCLLCIPFVTGILAGVFGFLGLRQTRQPDYSGKGLAIAGLILGILNVLGWTAYFILIVAVMVPALGKARTAAGQIACSVQMRQISTALVAYTNENQGSYPPNLAALSSVKSQQAPSNLSFTCPAPSAAGATGAPYVYLGAGKTVKTSKQTILLYEPIANHTSGANFLYADGRVQFQPVPLAQRLIKELQAGHNPPRPSAAGATGNSD